MSEYDASIQNNVVSRISGYAGKKRNEVTNPNLTAREAIALADYYESLRQQLESAQTEINNQAKAYGLLNQQLEVAQKESNTHKLLRDEAHNTYDAAMVTIGDILGIDVRDEPRCKWVALGASKIMRKLAQCEADARRYRWLRDNTKITSGLPFIARSHDGRISAWTTEYADTAVDEAIAAEGAGEEGK